MATLDVVAIAQAKPTRRAAAEFLLMTDLRSQRLARLPTSADFASSR
jgi:hypothetical protein